MTTKTDNRAEQQAASQYQGIVAMLAALRCDYDRLQELRDLKDTADECGNDAGGGDDDPVISGEEIEELIDLEAVAGDCTDEEDARQRIQEDPLAVEVRSDWTSPGEPLEPSEFMILLCTGGPAVRIVGELNRGEPCRARLEYQDWGTPWARYFGADSATLCQYASHFYFEE
jgi:hypothetical protein